MGKPTVSPWRLDRDDHAPALSGDGRYVLFLSKATNLVAGDGNAREDIFLHDRDVDADGLFDEPGQISTRRLSVRSDGSEATCFATMGCSTPNYEATLSRDGRHVVFSSRIEFDAADLNGVPDVYLHDVALGRTTRVSLRPGGAPASRHLTAGLEWQRTHRSVHLRPIRASSATTRMVSTTSSPSIAIPTATASSTSSRRLSRTSASSPAARSIRRTRFPWPSATTAGGSRTRSHPTLGIFNRSTGHNSLVWQPANLIAGSGQFSTDNRYFVHIGFGTGYLFVRTNRDTDADGTLDEPGAVASADPLSFQSDGRGPASDGALRSVFDFPDGSVDGLAVRDLLGPAPAASIRMRTGWRTASRAASA